MKAVIIGVNGQDGSYLSEFLLDKGYEVHGTVRRSSTFTEGRLHAVVDNSNFYKHYADLSDSSSLRRILNKVKPDEVYNLAAQSDVAASFDMPVYTADAVAIGVLRLLEIIRELSFDCKLYQASTSEIFGGELETVPQNENTTLSPKSPYAASKVFAHHLINLYRESYGIFACSGILFNHESPRRGDEFVTKKVINFVKKIRDGESGVLKMGNIDAERDWGHSLDYVKAQWMMLQQDTPRDFVISSGESVSVRKFIELSFSKIGLEIEWTGEGLLEKGISEDGEVLVEIDKQYFRPNEVEFLRGDSSLAVRELGWNRKITLSELIDDMLENDI